MDTNLFNILLSRWTGRMETRQFREIDWQATTELLKSNGQLICPQCTQPYTGERIFQCERGHLFCQNCDASLWCNTCQGSKPRNIRNRRLESLAFTPSLFHFIGATEFSPDLAPAPPVVNCDYCTQADLVVWFSLLIPCRRRGCRNLCAACIENEEFRSRPCILVRDATQPESWKLLEIYRALKTNRKRSASAEPSRLNGPRRPRLAEQ